MIAVDRRGRGDSTDHAGYALEREYEDVAAVVRDAGAAAVLAGHSYGAGGGRCGAPPGPAAARAIRAGDGRWARHSGHDRPLGAPDRRGRSRRGRPGSSSSRSPATTRRRSTSWRARRSGACAGRSSRPCRASSEPSSHTDSTPMTLAESRTPTLLLLGTESPDWAVRSVRAHAEAIRAPRPAPSRARGTAQT